MKATLYHRSAHLTEADVYASRDQCPACLSREPRPAVFRIQDNPVIDMLACPRCGIASASQMPKPEVLDRYYASYYSGSDRKTTTPHPGRFARRILKRMPDLPLRNEVRILDYGGGDGSVARAIGGMLVAGRSGKHVAIDVVDYEEPGRDAVAGISVAGHRTLDGLTGAYDLIIASAILEHIPNVNAVFRQLVGLAASGGYFYGRTPYALPLARVLGKFDLTFPAHVHDVGSAFWNRVVETFELDARLIWSGPSIVETAFFEHPARALAAHLMKFPCNVELMLNGGNPKDPVWKLVGGWEAYLRFNNY